MTTPGRQTLAFLLASGALAACPSNSPYGSMAGAHSASGHSAGSGPSSGSGATGTGSSSSSSSSSTSSTGGATGADGTSGATSGSTSGLSCPNITTLDDCDAGIELRTQIFDLVSGTPAPLHEPVAVEDLYSMDSFVTNPCGQLYVCGASPSNRAFLISLSGYATGILEDLQLTHSELYDDVVLFSTAYYSYLTGTLTPAFIPDEPAVYVVVRDEGLGCPVNGWSFELTDLDGGPVSAELDYYAGFTPSPQPPTTSDGFALFYNLATTASQVRVTGTLDPDVAADAGLQGMCAFDGGLNQYLGTVHILPSALSVFLYDVP